MNGPLRMLVRVLAAATVLCAAFSCQSFPSDTVARSPGDEEIAAFDSFDLKLLDLRIAPDPAGLAGLRAELDRAASRPGLSRGLQSRAQALRAEAALLAGDLSAAKRLADAAASLSDAQQGVWVVRAALEQDPAQALALLDTGIVRAVFNARLLCERGEIYLKTGRYPEAAQDLDEGLRLLDARYRALYGADRDRAVSLAQTLRETGSPLAIAQSGTLDSPITNRAMVEMAFSEPRLLGSLSPEVKPRYESVLPALSAAGLLPDPSAPADSLAPRKSVGFFLWGLMARLEHNPKLLTVYRLKYTSSPVADVALTAPEFDAVLGVVEREIMELPDGVNFRPEQTVTGLQYLGMLGKLLRQYR
jgi:tetratricopeptide (TPR) repeat protein